MAVRTGSPAVRSRRPDGQRGHHVGRSRTRTRRTGGRDEEEGAEPRRSWSASSATSSTPSAPRTSRRSQVRLAGSRGHGELGSKTVGYRHCGGAQRRGRGSSEVNRSRAAVTGSGPPKTSAPSGSWPSPFSAATVAGAKVSRSGLQVDGPWAYWLESRPDEGGRQVLVRAGATEGPTDVSPAGRSIRSRVHEYGGGAATVADGTCSSSIKRTKVSTAGRSTRRRTRRRTRPRPP